MFLTALVADRVKIPIDHAGDTIVEVLIAILIVSAVLVGAFLVSQHSASSVRNSQEHAEMLQVLNGQVELTRSLALKATSQTSGVFSGSPAQFCIDNSVPSSPAKVDASSSACKNIQGHYSVTISHVPGSNNFNFAGSWNGVGGTIQSERLSYRIYPGSFTSP